MPEPRPSGSRCDYAVDGHKALARNPSWNFCPGCGVALRGADTTTFQPRAPGRDVCQCGQHAMDHDARNGACGDV